MAKVGCGDNEDVIYQLQDLFGTNRTEERYLKAINNDKHGACGVGYGTSENASNYSDQLHNLMDLLDMVDDFRSMPYFGGKFYSYVTPFIILLGLIGNFASLGVFLSKRLRHLSASLYLAALSASDSIVLITYVFMHWLSRGLIYWPGNYTVPAIHVNGVCHAFLFISYSFRFISVYLIVVFTIERYIAVCKPLHRRMICTKNFARKLIVVVHLIGIAVSLFKPILSGVYYPEKFVQTTEQPLEEVVDTATEAAENAFFFDEENPVNIKPTRRPEMVTGTKTCMRNPEYDDVNFVMELVYGLLITAIPFVLMSFFNLMIIRRLIIRYRDKDKLLQINFRDSKIRWEFTIMLLVVSSCFILLSLPYFAIWIQQFQTLHHSVDIFKRSNLLLITRTIFNINYCINFFVYCLTGSYYRAVIRDWFSCGNTKLNTNGYTSARKPSCSITMTTQGTFV